MPAFEQGIGPLRARLLHQLATTANSDGGWPYFQGKASRIEPTASAVMALCRAPGAEAHLQRGLGRLYSWQQPSGLLAEPGLPANPAFSALALLAYLAGASSPSPNPKLALLVRALGSSRGVSLEDSPNQRQRNDIPGWAWLDGNFSWVEPTAWATLALKVARARGYTPDQGRIAAAERLFEDRVCAGGGWNYGNSNVLGKELNAYVPTTALALLALHDRRDRPFVVNSLGFLQKHWRAEESGLALALTRLCLRRYGSDVSEVDAALDAAEARTSFMGNLATIGLVAAATAPDEDSLAPFSY